MDINWTRPCSDVVAFSCLIMMSATLLRIYVRGVLLILSSIVIWYSILEKSIIEMCELNTRTGGQTGIGGGRTRGQSGDQGNGEINSQGGQGTEVNDGVGGVLEFFPIIAQQLHNLLPTILAQGCTYKEFLACNPKEYDGMGGAIVYIRWIEKMESVQDMSGCRDSQKRAVQKAGTLIDEAVRNGSLKRNLEKSRNSKESSRVRNVRDENKMTRTGNAFATTTNPIRREYNGTLSKYVSCNLHHPSEIPCRACFNYGRLGHMVKDSRVAPKMVNSVNARNPTAAPEACYECGGTDQFKAACPRLNQAQRLKETAQIKLLLIMGDMVMGTTITRHVECCLYWEQRGLARTQTS
nr:reverse transcriptase domain-containing protein [Tanacetum cinerariifolium]